MWFSSASAVFTASFHLTSNGAGPPYRPAIHEQLAVENGWTRDAGRTFVATLALLETQQGL
ncbi:hypothetical protein SAMN05216228_102272 [Rhizobium tibeticum]|uniref:Uncharacterized protein n=1 Tax=Rhizobium tibeticum TaxID=501024 RepID=A0A1H8RUI5_9HYPH|nr:hypothetical protein RTCCBAU85039_4330 [Rhizobium tibeticum]SEO70005.1 hypothetical protein SAMN05216228_102272 [Rhizobium tibeticum]